MGASTPAARAPGTRAASSRPPSTACGWRTRSSPRGASRRDARRRRHVRSLDMRMGFEYECDFQIQQGVVRMRRAFSIRTLAAASLVVVAAAAPARADRRAFGYVYEYQ